MKGGVPMFAPPAIDAARSKLRQNVDHLQIEVPPGATLGNLDNLSQEVVKKLVAERLVGPLRAMPGECYADVWNDPFLGKSLVFTPILRPMPDGMKDKFLPELVDYAFQLMVSAVHHGHSLGACLVVQIKPVVETACSPNQPDFFLAIEFGDFVGFADAVTSRSSTSARIIFT